MEEVACPLSLVREEQREGGNKKMGIRKHRAFLSTAGIKPPRHLFKMQAPRPCLRDQVRSDVSPELSFEAEL